MTATTRKTAAPRKISSIPVKQSSSIPTGRLLELMQETVVPESYELTADLIIDPPTKERADKIRSQQYAIMVAQTMLNNETASDNPQRDVLDMWLETIKAAQTAYTEALFGDRYEEVLAFFAQRPDKLWQAFENDIQAQFFPNQPPTGECPTCGHTVDPETVGKE